ncbi:23S rRNA (uracil(1939)-C(5))-methyltransferase RlmD [Vibrio sp. WJH972]
MARFFQPKKKTSHNSKHIPLVIEKLDHQGCGIAYYHQKPVFIDGGLPQEEVLVQFSEEKSKYARAKIVKILERSPLRQKPFCSFYHMCGGCDMQHLSHSQQVTHKEKTLSYVMNKVTNEKIELEPTISASEQGYRRRARVSLRWDKKQNRLEFGFRQKQSKNIVTIEQCPVLEPELNKLLSPLKLLLETFYSPETLGHLEVVLADSGAVIVLRHTKALKARDQEALIELAASLNATLYLMPQNNELDYIDGPVPVYSEVGVSVEFKPNNFIQVNRAVNQGMVAQAIDWLQLESNDKVLDLFCGVGNFSLPIAKRVSELVGIEGVDSMVEQASANAALNDLKNATFFQANLEKDLRETSWGNEQFDKILLDPARAGAQQVVAQLSQFSPQRIVYVSCNPATLARDSQVLIEQGYHLEKLAMLDMFPHTGHLESMALFVR